MKLQYNKDTFLLDGKPFRILSGAIHYFRVPQAYWEDRLRKLRACGFNTVETYCCWNLHEKQEGSFDFSGMLDVRRFLETAQRVGLYAIVRPGPFICAEIDNGGLPYPASRIACTMALTGRVEKYAAGPPGTMGTSTGCAPSLSGIP